MIWKSKRINQLFILGHHGNQCATRKDDSSKKKQGKKTKTKTVKNKVVVLGTDVGSIWIYSVEQERIIKKLPGVTDSRLVDVILNKNGTHLYFLSHTGAIVAWSVEKDQPIAEWKTNLKHTHALAVNDDDSLLAVGGEGQIELWDISKGQIIKTFKCQDKHSIQQLAFSQHGSTLVSSNGKKSIELWNTQHGSSKDKKTSTKPTHSILMNDDDGVRHLDLTSTTPQDLTLLTVSDKGTVTVWKSQAAPGTVPAPTTTIKVMASKQDQIPVLWARLTRPNNNKTGHAVVIARGSSARPLLETVDVTDDQKEIVLTRQTAGVTQNAEDDEEEANSDDDEDDNMELDATQHTPEQLIKALQVEDKKATLRIMKGSSADVEQVDTLVRRLPLGSLRFIVSVLADDLQGQTVEEARSSSLWLKRVVSFYYRHLMSDDVIINKLASLSEMLSLHATNTLPKVLALRGRVEMIQQQLDMQAKRAQLEEEDALLALEPMEGSDGSDDSDDSDDDDDDHSDDLDDDLDDDVLDEDKDEDMFLEEADEQDDMAESDMDDSVASM
ncbi:unnamed protein product [Absidia cylindrospora]